MLPSPPAVSRSRLAMFGRGSRSANAEPLMTTYNARSDGSVDAAVPDGPRWVPISRSCGQKLGLHLANMPDGSLVVSKVFSGYAVARNGTICVGDVILEVDCESVAGKPCEQVLRLLSSKQGDGDLCLCVQAPPGARFIQFDRVPGAKLGVDLIDCLADTVAVGRIHEGLQLSRTPLAVFDVIVSVNGQSTGGMNRQKVAGMVSALTGLVSLRVQDPLFSIHVLLTRAPGEKLGIDLGVYEGLTGFMSLNRVYPGYAAARFLQAGDVILAVDGRSVYGLSHQALQDLLTRTSGDLALRVVRPQRHEYPHFHPSSIVNGASSSSIAQAVPVYDAQVSYL